MNNTGYIISPAKRNWIFLCTSLMLYFYATPIFSVNGGGCVISAASLMELWVHRFTKSAVSGFLIIASVFYVLASLLTITLANQKKIPGKFVSRILFYVFAWAVPILWGGTFMVLITVTGRFLSRPVDSIFMLVEGLVVIVQTVALYKTPTTSKKIRKLLLITAAWNCIIMLLRMYNSIFQLLETKESGNSAMTIIYYGSIDVLIFIFSVALYLLARNIKQSDEIASKQRPLKLSMIFNAIIQITVFCLGVLMLLLKCFVNPIDLLNSSMAEIHPTLTSAILALKGEYYMTTVFLVIPLIWAVPLIYRRFRPEKRYGYNR